MSSRCSPNHAEYYITRLGADFAPRSVWKHSSKAESDEPGLPRKRLRVQQHHILYIEPSSKHFLKHPQLLLLLLFEFSPLCSNYEGQQARRKQELGRTPMRTHDNDSLRFDSHTNAEKTHRSFSNSTPNMTTVLPSLQKNTTYQRWLHKTRAFSLLGPRRVRIILSNARARAP